MITIKTGIRIILIILCFTISPSTPAQSSSNPECKQLETIMDDAGDYFASYAGQELYDDYYLSYYEYDFKLWNDEGRELYYDGYGNAWADFYFHATYDYSEGAEYLDIIMEKVKKCLPSSYFLSSTENEYSLKYFEFSDDRDQDQTDNPEFIQVQLSLDEKEDFYYVTISVFSPAN